LVSFGVHAKVNLIVCIVYQVLALCRIHVDVVDRSMGRIGACKEIELIEEIGGIELRRSEPFPQPSLFLVRSNIHEALLGQLLTV
jgi:hypothetical protein